MYPSLPLSGLPPEQTKLPQTPEQRMRSINWKRVLLVGGVATIGGGLLVLGISSTLRLPILSWRGLASFTVLLVLTFASSRFTVPVTNVDGVSQSHKSVADAFIFLAVMM